MMKKTLIAGGASALALGAIVATLVSAPAASAEALPSAKAAVAINELIDLSAADNNSDANPKSTGWVNVLSTQIKTSSQKDLVFDAALQCGIVTDTTVKSSGGATSASTARANIAVRVLVDGVPAEPDQSIDATKETAAGVVYCDRIQTLAAKFAGLDCTTDLATGAITCATEEELQLILRTLNAHSFNFAKTDVGTGVHDIVVQAKASADVNFDDGNLAGAEAFAGAGSLSVEEVRLVKGAEIVTVG
jgi:hypothetical protein